MDLRLEALTLPYGVSDLSLAIGDGQLVSLLGPSGCGKTTTLRAVAGLLPVRSGRIWLGGDDITQRPAHRRDIGLVFQSYALFPHLSAYDNVAFGLRLRQVAAAELKQRVQAALDSVGLQGFEQRLPAQLSGGQQQRVAVARAIVIRPRLLLLDEPLSNLDARLRVEMRAELRRLQRELGTTMVYVTHDQEEALALSDRIVVMREGRIEQDGPPEDVYHCPATAFVAAFMGWQNLFDWRDGALHKAGASVPLPLPGPPPAAGRLAWRPQQVAVLGSGQGTLDGRVLARSYLGEHIEFLVQTPIGTIKGVAGLHAPWVEGQPVAVQLDPARAAFL
jgi:putative spermidine/putrescine transport system ATP-binding protein